MNHSSTPPAPLASPVRARVTDQIVEILTEAIVDGRYPPSTTLPPERELAEQLGVNRTSLRHAISQLEHAGLVASRQGRGTVVLDPGENPDPAVLARLVAQAGPALVEELFEVREGIVTMAARLAADRARAADLDRLRTGLSAVRAATTAAERQEAELAWFDALVEATHNRALGLLVRWVWRAYSDVAESFEPAFADGPAIEAGLERVTRAVAAHRPRAAEQAMRDDARASGQRMLAAFANRPR